ncbi:hypothetical protein EVG20_g2459 [Dentipellis fragilis]|uniref:Uncharacterized protein n=1 Tax=Dentipellis fragilis TaxID=205917 RepID=A0A4Y9Z6R3_9AGAM|nr:hypothetical protein EVG20_g2459 [Dentipellis fragilis]
MDEPKVRSRHSSDDDDAAMSLVSFRDSPSDFVFPASPFRSSFRSSLPAPVTRRRFILAACSIFSVTSLLLFFSFSLFESPILWKLYQPPSASSYLGIPHRVDRLSAVLGPPTPKLKDNLRNDTKYVTSWISAGWTNDVMTYGNLVYLAIITERVPIIGHFIPSHIGGDAGSVPFSEVFDIDYLSQAIGMPVLEFDDVKDSNSTEIDELGCWSVWQAVQTHESPPRLTYALEHNGIDISYTSAPKSVQKFEGYEHDPHAHFWSVAALTYSEAHEAYKGHAQPSTAHQVTLDPDEQLSCFDYLYYLCATESFEYDHDFSPAWRFVVKNFRWTQRLQGLADGYLKRIFEVPDEDEVPPYIAIHARRTDFGIYCNDVPVADCFPSLAVFARRIAEIQEEVRATKGIDPQHVLMLSDEKDPTWWDAVHMLGWYSVDHTSEDTVAKYGRWYPLLIDAVMQSSGIGFVGTDRSTMSVIAKRRVEDWQGGAVRMVKWGTPGADDH